MGGNSSTVDPRRQVKGGILIQLEKTAYISKDVIQGMLFINLEEPFQGHVLQITLEGQEETHFTYTVTEGTGDFKRTKTCYAHGLNQFLNFSIPVYDFAMGQQFEFTLQPGQWQIPFEISILENLPSSMSFFKSEDTRCHIRYTLKADIIPTDPNIRPISGSQEILIGQQINLSQEPFQQKFDSKPQICCCCEGGIIKLEAVTNQKAYAPSETINISLNCDLSGYSKKVRQLHISLEGKLEIKADYVRRIKVIQTYKQDFKIDTKGKININDNVTIEVPVDIAFTATGKLIQLEYSVQVKPELDTCWMETDNQPLVFPILINPTKQSLLIQPSPQVPQIEQPANWNPMLLQQPQFTQEQTFMIQQQQKAFEKKQTLLLNQQIGSGETELPIMTEQQPLLMKDPQMKYQDNDTKQQTTFL